jgi:rod shape-determining protein MreD
MIFAGGEGAQANHQRHWIVWLTLIISVIVDSFNWPAHWSAAIPDLTPLILLYWVMAIAQRNFIITAVILGIVHDVLYHSSLGSHALIYLLLLYPILYIRLQLRNGTLFQMSVIVGLWMFAHQLLSWLLHLGRISHDQQVSFWLASVVAMLLWPIIFISLRSLRRRMRVR